MAGGISVVAQIGILVGALLYGIVCLRWSLPSSLIEVWLSWCELWCDRSDNRALSTDDCDVTANVILLG